MNKLSSVRIDDIEYMRNRIQYYGEMPTPNDLLALLDEIEHQTSELEATNAEMVRLQEDTLEEQGYNRAIRVVEEFYRMVSRGTEEYSPERLASFLNERKG